MNNYSVHREGGTAYLLSAILIRGARGRGRRRGSFSRSSPGLRSKENEWEEGRR
jgi:hypothetical protein